MFNGSFYTSSYFCTQQSVQLSLWITNRESLGHKPTPRVVYASGQLVRKIMYLAKAISGKNRGWSIRKKMHNLHKMHQSYAWQKYKCIWIAHNSFLGIYMCVFLYTPKSKQCWCRCCNNISTRKWLKSHLRSQTLCNDSRVLNDQIFPLKCALGNINIENYFYLLYHNCQRAAVHLWLVSRGISEKRRH